MVGWGVAIVACGACCAGPLLVASGALAAMAAVAAIWVPSLIGVVLVAGLIAYVVHRRRRAAARCAVDGPVNATVLRDTTRPWP